MKTNKTIIAIALAVASNVLLNSNAVAGPGGMAPRSATPRPVRAVPSPATCPKCQIASTPAGYAAAVVKTGRRAM
jgi:hypothetical protein